MPLQSRSANLFQKSMSSVNVSREPTNERTRQMYENIVYKKKDSQWLFQTNVAQNAKVTGNLSFHQECAPFNEKSIGKNSICKQMHAPTANVLMGRRFAREKVAQSWSVHQKIKNHERDIAVPFALLCHNLFLMHTSQNVVILDAPSRHVYSITFTNHHLFRNQYFYSELSVIWINLIENRNSTTFKKED